MKRILATVAGALLLIAPAWWLLTTMVPVPEYRTGTSADYFAAFRACLTLYGGAAIGMLVQWARGARRPERINGRQVFVACLVGAIVTVGVVTIAGGGGTLSGLVIIFGGVFGVFIGAGGALMWLGLRGDGFSLPPIR
jgi:peptidoglycan/LPS O-acetylase OafA/YrhL